MTILKRKSGRSELPRIVQETVQKLQKLAGERCEARENSERVILNPGRMMKLVVQANTNRRGKCRSQKQRKLQKRVEHSEMKTILETSADDKNSSAASEQEERLGRSTLQSRVEPEPSMVDVRRSTRLENAPVVFGTPITCRILEQD